MRKMLKSFLSAAAACVALAGGVYAQQSGGREVREAFPEVLGRTPTAEEISEWSATGLSKAGIVKTMKTNLTFMLHLVPEVRPMIERAYAHGFGRKPKAEESDYWHTEIRINKKEVGFTDIVNASREFLKRPENDPERRLAIMNAYLNSMGRFPEAGDIDYWQKRMMSEGATFVEIAQASGYYMLGDTPAQKAEFRAAAARAFEMVKAPAPTEEQLQKVMNHYRDFAQKQTAIQGGKPARLRFWLMVMDAGLMAHGKYPKPEDVPPAVSRF